MKKRRAERKRHGMGRFTGNGRWIRGGILLLAAVAVALSTVSAVTQRHAVKRMQQENQALSRQVTALQQAEQQRQQALEAAAPEYQKLYPDFYAPRKLSLTQKKENTVYLTFDDGPSPVTDGILDTLQEKGVKATFYVVPKNTPESLERLKRMAAEGHTLGMHSASHDYRKIYESVEAFLADLYEVFRLLRDQVGYTPTCFRFPGGSINGYNTATYEAIEAEMLRRGFVPCDWNVSSGDAAARSVPADRLQNTVVNQCGDGARCVVLMHDASTKATTAQALPGMIDRLRARGFAFAAMEPDDVPVLFGRPRVS